MPAAVTATVGYKFLLLAETADLRKTGECVKFREYSDDGLAASVCAGEGGFYAADVFFRFKTELFEHICIERG